MGLGIIFKKSENIFAIWFLYFILCVGRDAETCRTQKENAGLASHRHKAKS